MFTCRAHTTADLPSLPSVAELIPGQGTVGAAAASHTWKAGQGLEASAVLGAYMGQQCHSNCKCTLKSGQLISGHTAWCPPAPGHAGCISDPTAQTVLFLLATSGHPQHQWASPCAQQNTETQKSTKSHHHRGCQAKRHGCSQASRAGSGQVDGA